MKHAILCLVAFCFSLALGGCATAPPISSAGLFHDGLFKPPTQRIDTEELFALSPQMKAYLDTPAFRRQLRLTGAVQGMIDALYSREQLQLDYDATATRPAAETFAARKGNCLSLVIMTAAFAKALNLDVFYRDVAVDEQWARSGGVYLSSTHVNLSLANRTLSPLEYDMRLRTVIDFIPISDDAQQKAEPISEATIVAMYLNNRAGEALAEGKIDDAYWWARESIKKDATFLTAYNTLGVAYYKHGNYQQAELAYKRALERSPNDTIVMGNLVQALLAGGKAAESAKLAHQLAALRPEPPYFHFEKGMAALQSGDLRAARQLFAREVQRAPYNHEFHYWLAVTDLRLGNARAARAGLAAAIDHSTTAASTRHYTDKLNYLRSLAASTSPLPR